MSPAEQSAKRTFCKDRNPRWIGGTWPPHALDNVSKSVPCSRRLLAQHATEPTEHISFATFPPFEKSQDDTEDGREVLEQLPDELPASLARYPLPKFANETPNIE